MKYEFPEIGEAKIGEFPLKVGAEWLVHWIAEIEDRDDPFEGPLPHHILRFGQYELRDVELMRWMPLRLASYDVTSYSYRHKKQPIPRPDRSTPPISIWPLPNASMSKVHSGS